MMLRTVMDETRPTRRTKQLCIITGGQTGVDTAGIKAAITLQMPYRGWVPKGFTNEAGVIPEQYRTNLHETPSPENAQRTEWNMRDAHIILTVLRGSSENAIGGTKLGLAFASEERKPMCFVDLTNEWADEIVKVQQWIGTMAGERLAMAVGGPRESEEPGFEADATRFSIEAFRSCN